MVGNGVIRDPLRQGKTESFALFKCGKEVIAPRFANAEKLRNLVPGHSESVVFDDNVFVIQHNIILLKCISADADTPIMKDCWVTSNKLRNGSAGWPLRPGKAAVLAAHQWPLPRALCTT